MSFGVRLGLMVSSRAPGAAGEPLLSDELRHECGIAALYWLDEPMAPEGPASLAAGDPNRSASRLGTPADGDVTPLMPRILLDLQNRGQLAAGISRFNPDHPQLVDTFKDVGTVTEVFRMSRPQEHLDILERYAGPACIGHTRYATCGIESATHAQPFERHHGRRWKWFSFAFNGQLANYTQLRDRLLARQAYHFALNTDTEIIMHQLSYGLRGDRQPNLVSVMRKLGRLFDGSYNLAFLNAMGDMFVARDPLGFRPLCYGFEGRLFAAASESAALTNLGFSDVRTLEPGTMALVHEGKITFRRFAPARRHSHCFFEWVYFANVASEIDSASVYLSRMRSGQRLAEKEDQPIGPDCIVVPVPDTAKAAADAFAFKLGIPSVEGLIRNRYVGRTFIQPLATRGNAARSKYSPLRAVLEGKRVFLVEDSIVRSTTLQSLVDQMRSRGGAKEIHVRVACPPIVAPCFYGIDMSTRGELFAPPYVGPRYKGRLSEAAAARMAKRLGVDSLRYLDVQDLGPCIQVPQDGIPNRPYGRLGAPDLCLGCVLGRYPTPSGRKLLARARRAKGGGKRTYE